MHEIKPIILRNLKILFNQYYKSIQRKKKEENLHQYKYS